MTYDDGILTVYNVKNIAQAGDRPVMGLEEKGKYYFSYSQIGVTRYYNVAPLAGAWIEIVCQCPIHFSGTVAPLAGAWIEIFFRIWP